MNSPALLKVLLGENSSQRMAFQNGFPGSVDELVSEVQRQCGLDFNSRLQFMDALFGNDFMNLTSMDEVQDRGTIRVIAMTDSSTPQCPHILPTSAAHRSLNDSSSLDALTLTYSLHRSQSHPALGHLGRASFVFLSLVMMPS